MTIEWVRLSKYCEATGESPGSVNQRIKRGGWLKGVHWQIGPDRRRWINIRKAQEWVVRGHLQKA